LTLLGRKCEEPNIDGVILSHAHADHANYVSFLHKDIPVYCGETAYNILEAVEESSQRSIETEITNFKERPLINYRVAPIKRNFLKFRTGDKLRIKSLEIEPIHVDHSVPGAYGFIIHTTEGSLVYTGDLRLHGTHAEMTEKFIQKAMDSKPVAMITEGTRIDIADDDASEAKVYTKSRESISKTKNLAIVDFNFKDVDRLRTFYNIAKETGRKFVISFKHACFLERYSKDKTLNIPSLDDPHIAIYKLKRKTGLYRDQDYKPFERRFLDSPNLVTADEIRNNQRDYLMVLNFWSLNELIDLRPRAGSTYVHSLSEPFNEEMEISQERMNNWIKHFNLNKIQSHCSGHATGNQIKEMIDRIKPKKLFPIHTEHPEFFNGLDCKTISVVEGEKFIVS
jgi:ribonuclease J